MPRDKTDPQPLMANLRARRQRLLMPVERRIHIELCLQFLRRQIRDGMAEIEVVREMLPLTAEKFILLRRLKVRRKRSLRIRKGTAACAHHLGETPLLIRRDLLMGTHEQNRFDCLVDIPLMNVLTEGGIVVKPTHSAVLSNLKYAISGGQPIRSGNQLPLPECT